MRRRLGFGVGMKAKFSYIIIAIILFTTCSTQTYGQPVNSPKCGAYYGPSSSSCFQNCNYPWAMEGAYSVPYRGAWRGMGGITIVPEFGLRTNLLVQHPSLGGVQLDTVVGILSRNPFPGLQVLGHGNDSLVYGSWNHPGEIIALGPNAETKAAVIKSRVAPGELVTLVGCHQSDPLEDLNFRTQAELIQEHLSDNQVLASKKAGPIMFQEGNLSYGLREVDGISPVQMRPVNGGPGMFPLGMSPLGVASPRNFGSNFRQELLSKANRAQFKAGIGMGALNGAMKDAGVDPRLALAGGLATSAYINYRQKVPGSLRSLGGGVVGALGSQAVVSYAGGSAEQQEAAAALGGLAGGFAGGAPAGVANGVAQVGSLVGEFGYVTVKGTYQHGGEYWSNYWATGYCRSFSKCYSGR